MQIIIYTPKDYIFTHSDITPLSSNYLCKGKEGVKTPKF